MSSNSITIKRYNHRMHPCTTSKKQELLKHLVESYQGKSLLIISDANSTTIELEDKDMTLCDDDGLSKMQDRQWDVVISFDLPSVAEDYLSRVSHATEMALVIADEKEQEKLFLIETALGKNLTRESIEGFNTEEIPKSPKRDEKRWEKPQRDTKSTSYPAKEKSKKFDSKYIGDDENGKPMFSGKTKDRNHRYDGTPRTEEEKRANPKVKRAKKSISVKSLKPSESDN